MKINKYLENNINTILEVTTTIIIEATQIEDLHTHVVDTNATITIDNIMILNKNNNKHNKIHLNKKMHKRNKKKE